MMSLRSRRFVLRLGLHSVVLVVLLIGAVIGTVSESQGASVLFGLLLLAYLVTLRANPLPRLLETRLFQDAECSACGQTIDLVGTWSCGCGLVTWEPRHALSPCRQCKTAFEFVQCPRCEQSLKT